MPLQNRVSPWGVLEAAESRGMLMGNRGVLHDEQRTVVRASNARAWIICQLEFKGRRRELMTPGHYTELFFLDEATALAAGHRPCFECRRDAAVEFQRHWRQRGGTDGALVGDIDRELSVQRRLPRSGLRDGKCAYIAELDTLPDGTMVEVDGAAWLVHEAVLCEWSHDGYSGTRRRAVERGATGWVLTPYATVQTLRLGYTPALHPSSSAT
jgi:hypothetical protein